MRISLKCVALSTAFFIQPSLALSQQGIYPQAACYLALEKITLDAPLECYEQSRDFEARVDKMIGLAVDKLEDPRFAECSSWGARKAIAKRTAFLLVNKGNPSHPDSIVLAAAVVSSCGMVVDAQEKHKKDLTETMDSWVGSSLDDLAMEWGAPTSTGDLGGGKIVATYQRGGCTQSFFARESGRIYSWRWDGGC